MLILHFIFINRVCETITSAQKNKTLLIFTENQQILFLTLESVKFISFMCDPAGFHTTSSTQTYDVILWRFFSQKSLLKLTSSAPAFCQQMAPFHCLDPDWFVWLDPVCVRGENWTGDVSTFFLTDVILQTSQVWLELNWSWFKMMKLAVS